MSKWVSVTERLPENHQKVLVSTKTGQAVSIFVDGKAMKKFLAKNGVASPADVPHYFCSQETREHALNGVTHWQALPEQPEGNK